MRRGEEARTPGGMKEGWLPVVQQQSLLSVVGGQLVATSLPTPSFNPATYFVCHSFQKIFSIIQAIDHGRPGGDRRPGPFTVVVCGRNRDCGRFDKILRRDRTNDGAGETARLFSPSSHQCILFEGLSDNPSEQATAHILHSFCHFTSTVILFS